MFNQFSSNYSVISETKNVRFMKTLPDSIGTLAEGHCEEREVKTAAQCDGDMPSPPWGLTCRQRAGPEQDSAPPWPTSEAAQASFADTTKPSSVCGPGQACLPSSGPPRGQVSEVGPRDSAPWLWGHHLGLHTELLPSFPWTQTLSPPAHRAVWEEEGPHWPVPMITCFTEAAAGAGPCLQHARLPPRHGRKAGVSESERGRT